MVMYNGIMIPWKFGDFLLTRGQTHKLVMRSANFLSPGFYEPGDRGTNCLHSRDTLLCNDCVRLRSGEPLLAVGNSAISSGGTNP